MPDNHGEMITLLKKFKDKNEIYDEMISASSAISFVDKSIADNTNDDKLFYDNQLAVLSLLCGQESLR